MSENEYAQLISQLNFIQSENVTSNLSDPRFSEEWSIGSRIYAYEYVDNEVCETRFSMYPVFSSGDLVALAIRTTLDDGEPAIQLTNCFVSQLREYYNAGVKFALLYDAKSCYAIINGEFEKLADYSDQIDYRSSLVSLNLMDVSNYETVQYSELMYLETLDLELSTDTILSAKVSNNSNTLLLPFVTQNPPSNICWAASVACIGNYLTSGSYTAKDIAISYYGATSWNTGANIGEAMSVLSQNYGITYSRYGYYVPSDFQILNNINAGYPVYSSWKWSNGNTTGGHAVVIRGIMVGSCVYVMDPEYGYSIANKTSNTYSYVSGYSGVTLTMRGFGAALG